MKHACFTLNTNLYGEGQHNNERNLMKNMQVLFLKKWGFIVCFLMAILLSSSSFAVSNLTVSGITSTYSTANGTYVFQSVDGNGRNTWKHSSLNYYIYFDGTIAGNWLIDNDQNNVDVLFYSTGNELTPAGASYTAQLGAGLVSVAESGLPEITVLGNGSSIGDENNGPVFGLYTKFGSVNVTSGTVTRTYTIKNDGTANLIITGVTFSGANTGDFAITTSPVGTIAASGQATLAVRFDPSAVGSRTATINIACNDADEATYNFDIEGYGYTPENLVVYGITNPTAANGVYTHQGVLNGEYEYWSSGSYYIYKNGNYWYIDGNTESTAYLFKDTGSANSPKAAFSWTPSTGTGSPIVVSYVASPEIVVLGNATSIDNNDATPRTADHTHFGTAEVGTGSITRTFTIQNAGGTNLQLTGSSPYIALSGANASDFTVAVLPATPMTSGNSTTFQINFIPSGEGGRTATVSIANNDGDENPFTFAIKGGGVYAKGLTVSGTSTVNGDYTYQGITDGFATWVHTSGTYRIYNSQYVPLDRRDWRIDTDTDPDNGVCYASPEYNSDPSPVGITPSSWAVGIGYSGQPVIVYYSSEINIQGNGNSIANGNVTPIPTNFTDFGSVLASSGSVSHSFTIQNTGKGSLYLTGSPKVAVSGTNSSDFTVTAQPTSPVAATSGSTTFTVLFDPSATGIRTATLSIVNDDSDENPYTFSLQGTGYDLPTATTNAASSITTTGATLNGTINANNASTTVTFDYGTTVTYDHTNISATPGTVTGASNTSVSASISGLTPNTTYHYRVKGVNTGGTTNGLDGSFTTTAAANSTFQTAGNWSLASNWSAGIPGSTTEATISANCTVDGNLAAGNLIISSTAALTISTGNTLNVVDLDLESDNNGTASLINNGTLNVSGTTSAQRYMTGSKWHVVSPIAAFGSISTFIQAPGNAIPFKDVSGTNRYAMMDYNETTNTWNTFYAATTPDILPAGKGYSVRRTSDGIVTFTGDLTSGTKLVSLSMNGMGWNCIGNPYTSAIGINTSATSTENLITKNSSILDASYACVYVWDEDASYSGQNCYKIISNSGFTLPGKTNLLQNYVSPGQGFFVKTAANSNILQFTAAMQSHQQTTALKSAIVSWPGIQLSATSAQANASTVITFNNGMTNGLDVTYDAGLLRGTSGLELYSRLVNDNGVDFAIQCLPESYNSLVIPLGVESKIDGEITFSAETVELPATCSVILEDKLTKTFTSLTNGATYKTTVSAGTTTVGRFYIHTGNLTTRTSQLSAGAFCLKAYPANGQIWIIGEVACGAKASLFDVNGQNLGTFNLQEGSRNSISATGLVPGVYLLNVTEASKRFNTKIVIY